MAAHSNRQAIIFCSCGFIFFFSCFFPGLTSAVADWMSIPYFHTWCGLSANLECMSEMKCAVRGSLKIQDAKKSPSGHHRTTLSGYIFATKACIDSRKKLVKQQYLFHMTHNMANFGPLAAKICWRVCDTPANFNRFRVLASLLHRRRSTEVNKTW